MLHKEAPAVNPAAEAENFATTSQHRAGRQADSPGSSVLKGFFTNDGPSSGLPSGRAGSGFSFSFGGSGRKGFKFDTTNRTHMTSGDPKTSTSTSSVQNMSLGHGQFVAGVDHTASEALQVHGQTDRDVPRQPNEGNVPKVVYPLLATEMVQEPSLRDEGSKHLTLPSPPLSEKGQSGTSPRQELGTPNTSRLPLREPSGLEAPQLDHGVVILQSPKKSIFPASRDVGAADISFLGNIDAENQLAMTMMDLAGHIQQQNSSRQRKLEELTEELLRARTYVQDQADTITKLKENSQVVIQAVIGQREKIKLNQGRLDTMKESCKLYQMTIKNLGKLIKQAELDKSKILEQLEISRKECEALSVEKQQLTSKFKKSDECLSLLQESFKEQLARLGNQNELLTKQLAEVAEREQAIKQQLSDKCSNHAEALRQMQEQALKQRVAFEEEQARLMLESESARATLHRAKEQSTLSAAQNKAEVVRLQGKISGLESREQDLRNVKDRLESEVSRLIEKIHDMEEVAARTNARSAELMAAVESNKHSMEMKEEEWQTALQELKFQVEDAQRRMRDAQAESERLRRELADERERLQYEVDALKTFGTDVDTRHAENIAALEQIRQSQARELERITEQNEVLQKSILEMHEARKRIDEEHAAAVEEVHCRAEAKDRSYEEELQRQAAERQSLLVLNDELRTELRNSISALEEQKRHMSERHDDEISKISEAHRKELACFADELNKLRSDFEEMEIKYNAAESVNRELFEMKPKQATLVKRVKELEQELSSTRTGFADAQREAEIARQGIEELREQMKESMSRTAQEIERLIIEKDALEVRRREVETQAVTAKQTIALLEIQMSEEKAKAHREFTELKKQFECAERRRESEKASLQVKINGLRDEKDAICDLRKAWQGEKADLQNQLVAKIEQNEALLQDIGKLRKNISNPEQIDRLEEKLWMALGDKEQLVKQNTEMMKEVASLRVTKEQYSDLHQDLARLRQELTLTKGKEAELMREQELLQQRLSAHQTSPEKGQAEQPNDGDAISKTLVTGIMFDNKETPATNRSHTMRTREGLQTATPPPTARKSPHREGFSRMTSVNAVTKKFRSPVRSSSLAIARPNESPRPQTCFSIQEPPRLDSPKPSPSVGTEASPARRHISAESKDDTPGMDRTFSTFSQIETMGEEADDDRLHEDNTCAFDELVAAVDADDIISNASKLAMTSPQKVNATNIPEGKSAVAEEKAKSPTQKTTTPQPEKEQSQLRAVGRQARVLEDPLAGKKPTRSSHRQNQSAGDRKRKSSILDIEGGVDRPVEDNIAPERDAEVSKRRRKQATSDQTAYASDPFTVSADEDMVRQPRKLSKNIRSSRKNWRPEIAQLSETSRQKATSLKLAQEETGPKKRQTRSTKPVDKDKLPQSSPQGKMHVAARHESEVKSPGLSITTTTTIHKQRTHKVYSTQQRKDRSMGRSTSVRATRSNTASRRQLAAFDTSSEDFAAALMSDDALFGWPPA